MTPSANSIIALKAALLSDGVAFDLDLFTRLSPTFYENQFVYSLTSQSVTCEHRFPQALVLGDAIIVACLRREHSRWSLCASDNGIQLCRDGDYVSTVTLPARPPYLSPLLSDGTPASSVIAVAGEDTPGFFLYPACYYFADGSECAFCGMRHTRATVGKHMASVFTDERIAEATRLFQQTPWRPIRLISISTGTCRSDQDVADHILRPLKALYDALDPKVPIHLLTHPPEDFSTIHAFREAGVTTIAFNLEVHDPDLFRRYCPGKDRRFGYDRWIEALELARDVFGDYNAYCGLVWGLEPVDSVIEGYELFLKSRIGIASNVFHADSGSALSHHPHPSVGDILAIVDAQAGLYNRYRHARTIFSVSMRSTLDWEVRRETFR